MNEYIIFPDTTTRFDTSFNRYCSSAIALVNLADKKKRGGRYNWTLFGHTGLVSTGKCESENTLGLG